ncbi:MAG: triphosphoribosyl-dephospho-CoA synthase [Solidesulfovibrio sp. DCME]|uniref:triphosphoribosyl-dephospho-CoA synthase n=1 Tax=Solidesulfovibrio sp. DCME TaxID=3447380 RepID=UPI003D14C6EB
MANRREWIGQAAQLACIFEVLAEKPGNVTRSKDCARLTLEQFLVSAAAVGPAFAAGDGARVGDIIARAAGDTKRLAGVNTNIGIVLLLAPLIRAAARPHAQGLRAALGEVLRDLDVRDAQLAFRAIVAAAPQGLDEVAQGDVRTTPIDYTLRAAMAMARDRDSLASEYVTDFAIVFEVGLPCLTGLWASGSRFSEAVVQTFLTILATVPDTDIARKLDRAAAEGVSRQAAAALALGGVFTEDGRQAVARFDTALRDADRRYNPGTTADLIAAVLFAFLLTEAAPEMVPELLARW